MSEKFVPIEETLNAGGEGSSGEEGLGPVPATKFLRQLKINLERISIKDPHKKWYYFLLNCMAHIFAKHKNKK